MLTLCWRPMSDTAKYRLLAKPHIRLSGSVDQFMYQGFRQ